ncbi:MAG: BamA/TamA family outer membrane protein [Ignavibacteria bacterium]|nr:BamA/TamA family outer membrane protein [Ignavibacteria bacterium]
MYKFLRWLYIFILLIPSILFSKQFELRTYSSFYNPYFSEVNKIEFIGNKSFSHSTLQNIIATKPTDKSLPHSILFFYYENITKNRAAPKILSSSLKTIILNLINEISFFKESQVEQDRNTISLFYYQNGFHDVKVNFRFFPDTLKKLNILRFEIEEGQQYIVNKIITLGLETLPDDLKTKIEKLRLLEIGKPFSETLVAEELRNIRLFLRENGYFYADYKTPRVIIDTALKVDTVFFNFDVGKVVKINNINFIDSIGSQKRVGYNVKLNHLDFKPGDIYRQSKILTSELNLYSLGTFELVKIDTTSLFAPNTDTSINLAIFLRYRRLREFGVGLFTNRTSVEKAINVGAEFSISDRNIFGGGQSANFFIRGFGIDFSRFVFERKPLEYEFQTGVNFTQPLLWLIASTRISLTGSILYSQRKVFGSLQLNTFSFPIKFPTRLPFWTYFNYLDIDLFFERQVPKNFATASTKFYENAFSFQDSLRIQQSLSIFGNLDKYINKYNPLLTTSIFGVNLVGDTRDNPLLPRKGRLTSIGFDGYFFFGIAKYYRINLNFLSFNELSNFAVLSTKLRGGHIFWFDKANSFVPYERHFFAGGANSIRGWPSRQLRYYKGVRIDTSSSAIVNSFLRDFVGNASLLETSFEIRFRFGRPAYIGKTLADILELFTMTIFLDAGNAYQWLVKNEKGDFITKYSFKDYFNGIALATGFGIGFITPAGPFFFDVGYPLYDPNKEKQPMKNPVFHIRLGYSF